VHRLDGEAGLRRTCNGRVGDTLRRPQPESIIISRLTSGRTVFAGLPLGQYDALIAIDAREGAEVVTYEIRIAPDKARK
jgi:hypothetical protein